MSSSSAPAAAARPRQRSRAGKRVIILEAGSYYSESDFVQSEVAAYQNLFLRGGFPLRRCMVSIARALSAATHRQLVELVAHPEHRSPDWAEAGLADVDSGIR
jgi:hypothetical protein